MLVWTEKEIIVSLVHLLDIGRVHVSFIWAVALCNALEQCFRIGSQVNDQVGYLYFFCQGFVNPVVHFQLIALQVDPGK